MDIVERYVHEVGIHLPARQRQDIEAELKSSILDRLEEEQHKTGKPASEDATMRVLKELGSPEKVAASYRPPAYLIGPDIYPYFILVLKIALFVVTLVSMVVLAVRITLGNLNTWQQFGDSLGSYWNGALVTVASVVVTFAILQRASVSFKAAGKLKEKEWDPAELLNKPDPHKIPLSTPIVTIIFTLAAMVVFNAYRDLISIRIAQDGNLVVLATLSDAFFRLLPAFNIMWVLQIVFQVICLFRGHWNTALRLAFIGLHVFSIGITVALLTGPSIVAVNHDVLNAVNTTGVTSSTMVDAVNVAVRIIMGISILGSCVEIGKAAYRMVPRALNGRGLNMAGGTGK